MRKRAKRIIPPWLLRLRAVLKAKAALGRVDPVACHGGPLASLAHLDLDEILNSGRYEEEWDEVEKQIASLSINGEALGVNPGDRRALYYLTRHLQAKSVLEIGTHIGASTVHIAAALGRSKSSGSGDEFVLTTVDICRVNDPVDGPWVKFGSAHSPGEMIRKLGCDDFVTFVTRSSADYLSECRRRYDLVFLDGSHAASTVYRDIPTAVALLNAGGLILLHDYFPDLKPLWPGEPAIPGPYLAVRRLQNEGADIGVLPLSTLPWTTKANSHLTSLALLGRLR